MATYKTPGVYVEEIQYFTTLGSTSIHGNTGLYWLYGTEP